MKPIRYSLVFMLGVFGCSATRPNKPPATAKDCKTEPNGDKMWYPAYPGDYYPEGYHVQFESWPAVCLAGKWVTDAPRAAELESSRRMQDDFLAALSTRKLSHAELLRITVNANIYPNVSYFAVDKYSELYELLLKQWELQTGKPLPFHPHLSTAKGEYNRSPQESDSRFQVESLIAKLQAEF